MNESQINFKPVPRQLAIRYPHFFKYKVGTKLFLDDAGKQLDQENMVHRPHEIIAIGDEVVERLGLKIGDYVYLNPVVLNPKAQQSMLLDLDIRCLAFDYNYVLGHALYAEQYEEEDADREIERLRQAEMDKDMVNKGR